MSNEMYQQEILKALYKNDLCFIIKTTTFINMKAGMDILPLLNYSNYKNKENYIKVSLNFMSDYMHTLREDVGYFTNKSLLISS